MPLKQAPSFSRLAISVLAGTLCLGCFSLLLALPARILFVDSATIVLSLVAVGCFLHRTRAGGPGRFFFLFLALAVFLHGALMTANLLAKQGLPWFRLAPSVGFVLNLAGPVLQGIAVFCWPTNPGRALRWREFLDALLFTNSLLLVFWLMGLGDLIAKSPLSLSQKAAHLLVFLDYALLMGLAIYRGLNASGRFANALGWMLAAFFLVSAGNLAWIGLDLRGLYHAGHPMDALFLLIASLYLLAALAPLPAESLPATKAARLSSLLLPYLPFLMALPMIIYRISHLRQGQDAVALWLGTGMMALLLLRQLVALWDSLLFSRSLEAQVRERTRALEESQALLLRNQRMNIMATLGAGLAHDLNNLLSVIVMTTDLLEEETQAGQAPKPRDLSALRNASTQASDLVKKLMAFGRRAESESHLFDLRERIQGIAKLLEKLATPAVRVEWEHDPNPLYLELDPMHIEQILVNLVANARDAMPTGGRIRIRTRLHQGPEGSLAELAVSDSGTGIPEEHRGQLFDAFFTTKEPGKGTGLGLASVKAIADECLATITVESVVSLGTTFTLRFPLAP
ncbi:MAG: hypothetical protein IPN59_01870 [Holophaga sp.]|nr:hypothetical protein [Holophaga sp.]